MFEFLFEFFSGYNLFFQCCKTFFTRCWVFKPRLTSLWNFSFQVWIMAGNWLHTSSPSERVSLVSMPPAFTHTTTHGPSTFIHTTTHGLRTFIHYTTHGLRTFIHYTTHGLRTFTHYTTMILCLGRKTEFDTICLHFVALFLFSTCLVFTVLSTLSSFFLTTRQMPTSGLQSDMGHKVWYMWR